MNCNELLSRDLLPLDGDTYLESYIYLHVLREIRMIDSYSEYTQCLTRYHASELRYDLYTSLSGDRE